MDQSRLAVRVKRRRGPIKDPDSNRKDSIMRPTALFPVVLALLVLSATGCRSIGGCGSCGSCQVVGGNCNGNTCDPCQGLSRTRLAQGGHLGHLGHGHGLCSTCNNGAGGGGLLAGIRNRALGGVGVCGCGLRGRLGLACGRCGSPFRGATEGTPYTEPYAGPYGPMSPTVGYPYYTTRAPRDFLLNNPPTIGR